MEPELCRKRRVLKWTLWEVGGPAATRKGYFPRDAKWCPGTLTAAALDYGINPVATRLDLNAKAENAAGPDILPTS
jgi:hypothetical protein